MDDRLLAEQSFRERLPRALGGVAHPRESADESPAVVVSIVDDEHRVYVCSEHRHHAGVLTHGDPARKREIAMWTMTSGGPVGNSRRKSCDFRRTGLHASAVAIVAFNHYWEKGGARAARSSNLRSPAQGRL